MDIGKPVREDETRKPERPKRIPVRRVDPKPVPVPVRILTPERERVEIERG